MSLRWRTSGDGLVTGRSASSESLPFHCRMTLNSLRVTDRQQQDAALRRLQRAGQLTTCEPNPKGPVFMILLERTFGKDIATRTLDTVKKCAWA